MGQEIMDLTIEQGLAEKLLELIKLRPFYLLQIPELRCLIARMRISEEVRIEAPGEAVHDHTITHNINYLMQSDALWRPDLIFNPLCSIEYVRLNVARLKLLIIGPRSEAEVFSAYAHGFHPDNVKAIDLISYSDLIDLGDMHALPYEDGTFDIVVAGWVLAYSNDNQLAAKEILRVSKPGAHIAVGCVAEPLPKKNEHIWSAIGGVHVTSPDPERPGKDKTVSRFYLMSQLVNLFKDAIDWVIFSESPHPDLSDRRTNLILIFRRRLYAPDC